VPRIFEAARGWEMTIDITPYASVMNASPTPGLHFRSKGKPPETFICFQQEFKVHDNSVIAFLKK
jgi:hypothetical protein